MLADEAAEDDITYPQQYLKQLLCEDYDTTKAFYDEFSADQKTLFNSFFGGEEVLEFWYSAELWMNAYEDDPDVMKKAYEGVRGLVVHVTSEM